MKFFSEHEDYYLKYGLDRDPFPEDVIDNIFYTTPELNHRIELIKHLLEFSQQLLVVTAPPGAGKTMLCRYLQSVFDRSWSVNVIRAIEDMTPESLAFAVIRELYPDEHAGKVPAVDRLYKYLEHCGRDQKLPVIIIDEGERLSVDAFEFILQLNEKAHNNTRFRFVILGEEKINQLLDDPRIKVSTTGILHNISIPLLTEAQTVGYLEHRLKSSGDIKQYPFTDKDAQHIYKVSGGAPGRINRLARQAMQGPALPGTRTATGMRNPIVIAALISVILVVSFLIYLRLAPEQPGPVVTASPSEQPEAITAAETEPTAEQRATTPAATTPPPARPGIEPPETIAREEPEPARPEPEPAAAAEESAGQAGTVITTTAEETPARAEPAVQPEAQAAAAPPEPAPVVERKQPPPATPAPERPQALSRLFAGLRGGDWIRAQDPENYVLQVLGAREITTLEQYLAGLPELRGGLTVIAAWKDGKPWYVFLYGLYPDHDTALRDINNLPAAARQSRPWPRPVAAVQLDLEKTR